AVATIETYKTLLTGGRPPGKFATKSVRYDATRCRAVSAAVLAACWAALGVWPVWRLFTSAGPWSALGVALAAIAAVSIIAAVLALRAQLSRGRRSMAFR